MSEIVRQMQNLGRRAREAASVLAAARSADKDRALVVAAEQVLARGEDILAANAGDLAEGQEKGLGAAMLDRLALDPERLAGIADSLHAIAGQADPVGAVIAAWERPNGLRIRRVRTPLGVIGVIYESRPNVTSDAGALCIKSGNAAILRCGSESFRSSTALHACLEDGLEAAGLPRSAVQLVPTQSREAVGEMLAGCGGAIDVVVPRGGRGLVERVQRDARVPVFAHLEGICHIYVDGAADLSRARAVVLNAKMRRTGICGAAECLLVDQACAATHLAPIVRDLLEAGCEVRGDSTVQAVDPRVVAAGESDWGREFCDAIIAVRMVEGVRGAIEHIRRFGSSHTEAILTEDDSCAEQFFRDLDSAILLRNASTQFADGGEFGLGAEIGIATGKMHARGPIGAEQLTTFRYLVEGDGAVRR